MTLTPEQLDELKRKHEATTKGPWKAGRADMVSYSADGDGPWKAVYATEFEGPESTTCRAFREECVENAQAIAALHNAFPALEQLARFGLMAKAFCEEHGEKTETVLLSSLGADSWTHFCALLESARALDGKERT